MLIKISHKKLHRKNSSSSGVKNHFINAAKGQHIENNNML